MHACLVFRRAAASRARRHSALRRHAQLSIRLKRGQRTHPHFLRLQQPARAAAALCTAALLLRELRLTSPLGAVTIKASVLSLSDQQASSCCAVMCRQALCCLKERACSADRKPAQASSQAMCIWQAHKGPPTGSYSAQGHGLLRNSVALMRCVPGGMQCVLSIKRLT